MKVARFNKQDWYTFGGAEQFADGSDPFIAQDENFVIIGDVNGVGIYKSGVDTIIHIESEKPLSPDQACTIVKAIVLIVTSYDDPKEAVKFLGSLYIV